MESLKQDIVLEMIAISLRDRTNINQNRKPFFLKKSRKQDSNTFTDEG